MPPPPILAAARAAAAAFQPLTLDELGSAALMDRIDRKYLVPAERLTEILAGLTQQYRVLTVGGHTLSRYRTRYFDTADLAFYRAHHAGRAPRAKVRLRRYVDSGAGFLEMKVKTRTGRTVKKRVEVAEGAGRPLDWLGEKALPGFGGPVAAGELRESMVVEFSRLTLVREGGAERITFDLMLTFTRGDQTRAFPGVVVAEVKQAGCARSPFTQGLRALNIREGSISKYCAGIACLEPAARSNRFRPALRRLTTLGASNCNDPIPGARYGSVQRS